MRREKELDAGQRADVHAWEGELPVPLPIVLGHEPAGIVDLVGPGVTWPAAGERVGVSWFQVGCKRCVYCQRCQFKFCSQPKAWLTNGRSFAEFMIVESLAQRIGVVGAIGDHAFRLLPRAAFGAGDFDFGERGFGKRGFRERGFRERGFRKRNFSRRGAPFAAPVQ